MLKKGQKVRVTIDNSYFNKGQIVEVHRPDKYGAWLIGKDIDGKHTHWYFDYNNFEVIDSVVESIIDKFRQRSAVGIKKYNTTLDRTDFSEDQWKDHLLEELMDAILYLMKIRNENKKTN
jgi:hypothetical protein